MTARGSAARLARHHATATELWVGFHETRARRFAQLVDDSARGTRTGPLRDERRE